MYPILHEILSDKKGGEIFTLFSPWHFLYIALAFGIIALVLWSQRNRSAHRKRKVTEGFLNIALGLYLGEYFLMPLAYGAVDIEILPFHVCTAMCLMCFLCRHIPSLGEFHTSFALLGLISNLVYLIYPAGVMWHAVHPLSYRVIQALSFHSAMTVYGVLTLVYNRHRLSPRDWPRDLAVTVGMTAWALLGNYAYNGLRFINWFFVVRDPFYILPEDLAPFVMPFLNIALFFAVEQILRRIIGAFNTSE